MVDNPPTKALETPAGEVSSDLNSLIEQFKHDFVLKGDFSTFISGLPSSTQTLVHKYLDSLEAGTIKPEDTYAPELIVLINSLATAFVMNNKLVAAAKAAELAAVPETAATVIDIPAAVEQIKITDMTYSARKEYIDGVIAAGNVETLVEEMTDGSTKQTSPEQDVTALISGKSITELYGPTAVTAVLNLLRAKLAARDVAFVANTLQQIVLRGVVIDYDSFGAGILMTAFVSSYHSLPANTRQVGIDESSARELIRPVIAALSAHSMDVTASMRSLFEKDQPAFAAITIQAVRMAIDVGKEGSLLADALLTRAAFQDLPIPEGTTHILQVVADGIKPQTYNYIEDRLRVQKSRLVRANAEAVRASYMEGKDGLGLRVIVADGVVKFGAYSAPKDGQEARLVFDFPRNNVEFTPGSPVYDLVAGKPELLQEVLGSTADAALFEYYNASPKGSAEEIKQYAERAVANKLCNMLWTFTDLYRRLVDPQTKTIKDPLASTNVNDPDFTAGILLVSLLNTPAYTSPVASRMKLSRKFYLPTKYLPADSNKVKSQLARASELIDLISDETELGMEVMELTELTAPVPDGLLNVGETILVLADGSVRNLVKADTLKTDITRQIKSEFDRGYEQSITNRFAAYKKAQADEALRQRVEELKAANAKISDYVTKYGAKYHKDGDLSQMPVVPKFALPASRTAAEAAAGAYQSLLTELQKIDLGKPSTNLQQLKTLLSSTIADLGGKLPIAAVKPPRLEDLRNEIIRTVNNMRTGDQSVDVELDVESAGKIGFRVAVRDVFELPTVSELEKITDFDAFMQELETRIAAGTEKYAQQVRAYAERVIDTLFAGGADSRLLKFIRSQNIDLGSLDIANKALWQKLVGAFIIGRFNSSKDTTKLMNVAYIDDPSPARELIRAVGLFAYNLQLPTTSRYGFAMAPGNLLDRWKGFNGDQEPTQISKLAGIMLTAFRQNDTSNVTVLDIPAAA